MKQTSPQMNPLKTRIHAAIMAALLSVSGASRQKQIPGSPAKKPLPKRILAKRT
jgi:hypothetical protein